MHIRRMVSYSMILARVVDATTASRVSMPPTPTFASLTLRVICRFPSAVVVMLPLVI
jgi:hypothetical protein